MMKQYRLVLCGWVLAAMALTSCVAKDSETGGNTSWLECATHAECPDGQHCNLSAERCEAGPVPDAGSGRMPDGATPEALNADCVACLATGKVWIPGEPQHCEDECLEDSSCFEDLCPSACTSDTCSCFTETECEAAGCAWYEGMSGLFPVTECKPEGAEPLEAGTATATEAGASMQTSDSGPVDETEQTQSTHNETSSTPEVIEAGTPDAKAPISTDASTASNEVPRDPDCMACLATGKAWIPGDPHECEVECYADASCFTDECPAACSADTCSCFAEEACENAGCVWSVGSSGGWPVTSCDRERPAFFQDAGSRDASTDTDAP